MATVEETIETLEAQKRGLIDNKRERMRKGCLDCSCDSQINDISARIEHLRFSNTDYSAGGNLSPVIASQPRIMGSLEVTLADFESDGYTYLNPSLNGNTTFQVFPNTTLNRYLDFELDGFMRLPQGGFVFDPTKFELPANQKLIIFII